MIKEKFISVERNIVHMNENTFKVLYYIYNSKDKPYLREIVNKTKVPYSSVQDIIKKYSNNLEIKKVGKNNYYLLKNNLQTNLLKLIIEIEKSHQLLNQYPLFEKFILELKKLKIPILIFGSYAKNTENKNSDLDILTISNKKINLPDYLIPIKLHNINISNIKKFQKEILFEEIKYNHTIISGYEFFSEVFSNDK